MSVAALTDDTIERFREPAFVVLLLIGAFIFAVAGAFLIVGISINTAPPAPYISPNDKRFLIAGSLVAMVIGAALIRLAARTVGW